MQTHLSLSKRKSFTANHQETAYIRQLYRPLQISTKAALAASPLRSPPNNCPTNGPKDLRAGLGGGIARGVALAAHLAHRRGSYARAACEIPGFSRGSCGYCAEPLLLITRARAQSFLCTSKRGHAAALRKPIARFFADPPTAEDGGDRRRRVNGDAVRRAIENRVAVYAFRKPRNIFISAGNDSD